MKSRSLSPVLLAAAVAAAVTACGSTTRTTSAQTGTATSSAVSSTSTSTAAAPKPVKTAPPPAAVHVARTQYGSALVDRRGFALYVFTRDTGRRSACYGACATRWPPYLLGKPPVAGADQVSRLLGTVRRNDGRQQATYAGHPLYYYFGDRAPGQVLCQAAPEFGGTWYIVASDGHAIH